MRARDFRERHMFRALAIRAHCLVCVEFHDGARKFEDRDEQLHSRFVSRPTTLLEEEDDSRQLRTIASRSCKRLQQTLQHESRHRTHFSSHSLHVLPQLPSLNIFALLWRTISLRERISVDIFQCVSCGIVILDR